MPEHRNLSEEQLEGALRSLPRRDPPAALRARVLAAAAPRPAFRLSYAVAVLVLLVIGDVMVMKRQESGLSPGGAVLAAPVVARAADPQLVALVREAYGASGTWRTALSAPPADDYLTLRHREFALPGKG